ncbi:hypothetical protein Ocin01_18534, partial [Orchesella cincta]
GDRDGVLQCWECRTIIDPEAFECDTANEGSSVNCTSPRAGLEPVCVAWIWNKDSGKESGSHRSRSNVTLKKFCSWVVASKIGDATENCDTHPKDSEKTVCWCKSKDNCNQEGILGQGKKGAWGCSGAESASLPPTLLALLTFGIIILRFGKLRFLLSLLLMDWLATSGFPAGVEALQCKTGYGPDSNSTICNETNPFCFIRYQEGGYNRESSRMYYGCLEEKEFTPERRHQGLNYNCIVDHTESNIDVWCYCNDKDDCNKVNFKDVGHEKNVADC